MHCQHYLVWYRTMKDSIIQLTDSAQGRIQEFWKGGPGKGQSPEQSAEGASAGGGLGGLPQKMLKNWMRFPAIWHILLGSEWRRISFKIGPLQNKKNSSGHEFETHRY